eukprot:CAMPEP_0117495718 /NCGR_PEP_ID=MMETSP0784-20121206/20279_1 /TAXON_ID=39447 /ORGANISM="" /LENGTH=796 /DNA_ID=CAMNT_0005290653 /DNA_START=51 /DNA_END=2442 /DNA_ORIENTATION=+
MGAVVTCVKVANRLIHEVDDVPGVTQPKLLDRYHYWRSSCLKLLLFVWFLYSVNSGFAAYAAYENRAKKWKVLPKPMQEYFKFAFEMPSYIDVASTGVGFVCYVLAFVAYKKQFTNYGSSVFYLTTAWMTISVNLLFITIALTPSNFVDDKAIRVDLCKYTLASMLQIKVFREAFMIPAVLGGGGLVPLASVPPPRLTDYEAMRQWVGTRWCTSNYLNWHAMLFGQGLTGSLGMLMTAPLPPGVFMATLHHIAMLVQVDPEADEKFWGRHDIWGAHAAGGRRVVEEGSTAVNFPRPKRRRAGRRLLRKETPRASGFTGFHADEEALVLNSRDTHEPLWKNASHLTQDLATAALTERGPLRKNASHLTQDLATAALTKRGPLRKNASHLTQDLASAALTEKGPLSKNASDLTQDLATAALTERVPLWKDASHSTQDLASAALTEREPLWKNSSHLIQDLASAALTEREGIEVKQYMVMAVCAMVKGLKFANAAMGVAPLVIVLGFRLKTGIFGMLNNIFLFLRILEGVTNGAINIKCSLVSSTIPGYVLMFFIMGTIGPSMNQLCVISALCGNWLITASMLTLAIIICHSLYMSRALTKTEFKTTAKVLPYLKRLMYIQAALKAIVVLLFGGGVFQIVWGFVQNGGHTKEVLEYANRMLGAPTPFAAFAFITQSVLMKTLSSVAISDLCFFVVFDVMDDDLFSKSNGITEGKKTLMKAWRNFIGDKTKSVKDKGIEDNEANWDAPHEEGYSSTQGVHVEEWHEGHGHEEWATQEEWYDDTWEGVGATGNDGTSQDRK